MNTMATRAASTAPKEKNTERAVTRYSFPRGIYSREVCHRWAVNPFNRQLVGRRQLERQAYPDGASKEKNASAKHRKCCGERTGHAEKRGKEQSCVERSATTHEIGACG